MNGAIDSVVGVLLFTLSCLINIACCELNQQTVRVAVSHGRRARGPLIGGDLAFAGLTWAMIRIGLIWS